MKHKITLLLIALNTISFASLQGMNPDNYATASSDESKLSILKQEIKNCDVALNIFTLMRTCIEHQIVTLELCPQILEKFNIIYQPSPNKQPIFNDSVQGKQLQNAANLINKTLDSTGKHQASYVRSQGMGNGNKAFNPKTFDHTKRVFDPKNIAIFKSELKNLKNPDTAFQDIFALFDFETTFLKLYSRSTEFQRQLDYTKNELEMVKSQCEEIVQEGLKKGIEILEANATFIKVFTQAELPRLWEAILCYQRNDRAMDFSNWTTNIKKNKEYSLGFYHKCSDDIKRISASRRQLVGGKEKIEQLIQRKKLFEGLIRQTETLHNNENTETTQDAKENKQPEVAVLDHRQNSNTININQNTDKQPQDVITELPKHDTLATENLGPTKSDEKQPIFFCDLSKKPCLKYAERIGEYFDEYRETHGQCVTSEEKPVLKTTQKPQPRKKKGKRQQKVTPSQTNGTPFIDPTIQEKLDHLVPTVVDNYANNIFFRSPWDNTSNCYVAFAQIHYLKSNVVRDCFFTTTINNKTKECWHRSIIGAFVLPATVVEKMGNENLNKFDTLIYKTLGIFTNQLATELEPLEQRAEIIDKLKGTKVTISEGNTTVVIGDCDIKITLYKLPSDAKKTLEYLCWSMK